MNRIDDVSKGVAAVIGPALRGRRIEDQNPEHVDERQEQKPKRDRREEEGEESLKETDARHRPSTLYPDLPRRNVRRGHDAFNRRDLDAYLVLHDPEVEFTPYERATEGLGPYHGHEDVRRWWRNAFAVLPDFRVELDEVRDVGEVVLVRGRLYGHGAGSGASFERTYWGAFRLRDQKVFWWHAFQSETEALEAVGL